MLEAYSVSHGKASAYLPVIGLLKSYFEHAEIERWIELSDGFLIAHLKEMILNVRCLGKDSAETAQRIKTGLGQ